MKYKQLTLSKRYHISTLIKEGYNQKDIATEIGVHPSIICREFKRFENTEEQNYNPELLQIEAKLKHIKKPKRCCITKQIEKYIRKGIKEDWAPVQIAGRLNYKNIVNITHEAIYQYIYKNKASGGRLYLYLVRKMKKYQKRDAKYNSRGLIVNRISISKRPKIVDNKTRIGDWEVDTIIGKYHQGSIVTIVDRKSRFTLMRILPTKEDIGVSNAIIELLYPIKQFTHTITSDNGKEFTFHENISKSLNTDFYFCDPYSSWQRGLNEHTNGLIRQYIPK